MMRRFRSTSSIRDLREDGVPFLEVTVDVEPDEANGRMVPRADVVCEAVEALVPQPPSGRTFRVELSHASLRRGRDRAAAPGRRRALSAGRRDRRRRGDGLGRARASLGAPRRCGSRWSRRSSRTRSSTIVTWGSSFSALAAGRRWSLDRRRGRARSRSTAPGSTSGRTRARRASARASTTMRRLRRGGSRRRSSRSRRRPTAPAVGWPLRSTDVDRMGHVNNAAYWAAVEQRLRRPRSDLTPSAPGSARLSPSRSTSASGVELVEDRRRRPLRRGIPRRRRRQGGRSRRRDAGS